MAYGIKYRHSYCNEYGVNSTVTILENGYSGAIKEIDAQVDPIIISQEGSDTNKFDTIRPSTASIGLIGNADFKLEELFTADERKYMVENHVGGVMVWRGFVIPNGFSHEWTGGTFPMEIIASDNLSTLKDFQFLNDNGKVISGRLNHIDILLKCLNKLDIGIDLLTLTNIVRQGGVAGEDPLFINTTDAYTFLNTDVKEEGIDFYYDNPQNAFNCEDVVNSICRLYGAKLYQSKGQWRFKRINVDYGSSISGQTFHRYNTLGVKIGTVPYNEVITIPCNDYSGEKAQFRGARLAMSEVYKSSQSRYAFRYLTVGDNLPSIIKNQSLLPPVTVPQLPPIQFVPQDWTVVMVVPRLPPATRTVNISPELRPNGDFPPNTSGGAVRIYGGSRRGGDSLRSTPISNSTIIRKGDRLSLKFWHKIPLINPTASPVSFYLFVRVILRTVNPARVFVLANSDTLMSLTDPEIPRVNHPNWVSVDVDSDNNTLPAMSFVGNRPNMAWVQEYILSSSAPEDGYIDIEFAGIGLSENESQPAYDTRTDTVIQATVPSSISQGVEDYSISYSQQKARLYNTEYKIGELSTGFILESNLHPSGIIYTSEQESKYTQHAERINLSTSDVQDINSISNILTNGENINKWNDSRNPYSEYKSLGLLLTQDIMRQYKNVWRVIEEDIKANGLTFDTTIEFEERSGERYVIQRGSISQKFNRLIGCTLIQVSATPDTTFVGSQVEEEDFGSESVGSGGGGSDGSSGGGGGTAPQDLQRTTEIGADTTLIMTAKGIRAKELLQVPKEAPDSDDIIDGEHYIWIGDTGSGGGEPPSGVDRFIDLLDVRKPLVTGQFLQWSGSEVITAELPIPSGLATESWVNANFSKIGHTHTIAEITGLQSALNGKENAFTKGNIVAGSNVTISGTLTGRLVGAGNITINSTDTKYTASNGIQLAGTNFTPVYGTSLNTIAQGNDSRINNGQTAYGWGDFRQFGLGDYGINNLNFSTETKFIRNTGTNKYGRYGAGINIGYGADSTGNIPRSVQIFIDTFGGESISAHFGGTFDGREYIREFWHSGNMRSNAQNDSRYVLKTGDTMTGQLVLQGSSAKIKMQSNSVTGNNYIDFVNNANVREGYIGFAQSAQHMVYYLASGDGEQRLYTNGTIKLRIGVSLSESYLPLNFPNGAGGRSTLINPDYGLVVKPSTSGGWTSGLSAMSNADGSVISTIGFFGAANTVNYGFLGKDYLNNALRWTDTNITSYVIIQSPSIDVTQNLAIPTSAPVSPVAGKRYIWISS